MTLTLASIMAPKLARGPQQTDEAHAWESREFLRTLLIGRTVTFKVLQTMKFTTGTRTFADVCLDGNNVAEKVVSAGWATVKDNRDGVTSAIFAALPALEAGAKESVLGVWAGLGSGTVRDVKWSPTEEEVKAVVARAVATKKPLDVVVEYVRDGGCMRALVLGGKAPWTMLTLVVAGVMCPRTGNSPEPYSLQAKHFTEMRLLHRKVQVILHSTDRNENVLCSVLHPKGNIAAEMLRCGLARVSDRSLAVIPKDAVLFRKAELEAKAARRCLFVDYTAPALTVRTFKGVVLEALSGDTVIVAEDIDDGTHADPLVGPWVETKISLSSVRVNRLAGSRDGKVDEPWAAEARDFLVSRLVGRRVDVRHEFTSKEGRAFATIMYMGTEGGEGGGSLPVETNIGALLVANGLAVLTKNVPVEEGTGRRLQSSYYDDMLLQEAVALSKSKGIHSTVVPKLRTRPMDLSTNGQKARTKYEELCSKRGALRYRASIEHVFAGSRFKVNIPSEGIMVQFSLVAVRAPLSGRKEVKGDGTKPSMEKREAEPMSDEARRFSKQKLLQRAVDIEIFDVDKNGIFLGQVAPAGRVQAAPSSSVTLNYALPTDTFANVLCRQGLARTDKYGIKLLPSETAQENLMREEAQAMRARHGLWAFVEPETEPGAAGATVGDGANDEPGLPAPTGGDDDNECRSPKAPPGLISPSSGGDFAGFDLEDAFPSLGLQGSSGVAGGAWAK